MYTVILNKRYRKHIIKRYFVRKSFKKTNNFHFFLGNFYGWILKIDFNCERLQGRFIWILFAYNLIFGRSKITSRDKHKSAVEPKETGTLRKRIATIIERLLPINPFFNDPTDRINHFIYLLIYLQKILRIRALLTI